MIPRWTSEASLESRRKAILENIEALRRELRDVEGALADRRVKRFVESRKRDLERRRATQNPPHWLDAHEDRHDRGGEVA